MTESLTNPADETRVVGYFKSTHNNEMIILIMDGEYHANNVYAVLRTHEGTYHSITINVRSGFMPLLYFEVSTPDGRKSHLKLTYDIVWYYGTNYYELRD